MLRAFAILLLVYIAGCTQRDRLPSVAQIDPSLEIEPIQTPTQRGPFDVVRRGVTYHITPLADYELRGLVVSYHNSDSFLDVYHSLWNDRLNFRDLGVVWGQNALSGIFRELRFESQDFTLFYECWDEEVWKRFRTDQVSNNHILASDPEVIKSLRAVGKGDQVQIRGVLCKYSHPGGTRSSSLSRKDEGNGACETVFVDSVTVLREANGGWRSLMNFAGLLMKLMVPVFAVQLWMAFRSKPAESAVSPPFLERPQAVVEGFA